MQYIQLMLLAMPQIRFNTLVDMVKWLIIVAVMEQSLDFALCCLEKSVANCDSLSFIQVQRPFLLRW
ncbi:hypothetical protein HanRHA438_Chr06g0278221 [Helianthus annuus]|uniref:Uncharacterized protein n=1 Tax=Helianthus annuus TaxID=4232 RepID=A0A9K3IUX5_HELAN|nr:hypothetical protein HanXRQr2_Chr06g0268961 [Helianthus annuus]KAJ0567832.1 hypothetical protein HanIR_Chr06g0289311 [Helianthus annuus]KAJ0574284.1 hypothetical protein HanHA89_Chr06g0236401 [Helianthus annuus]KAJ0738619.1 hypothetical protein HanLR1_Chr06g0220331 [Helianthus annuus]KAJ0741498.1 hypothetical protein HanOQP8_Chr06g0228741 [Helianthus annuus]